MKRLLPLIIILFLTACESIPNKPITRTLTNEELQKAIQKDSTFVNTYELIRARTILGALTDPSINKYRTLTYRRVHKFIRFAADSAYFDNLLYNAEKQWDKKYSHYSLRVDSLSERWEKYIDELAPKNFVSIEAVGADKEYYSYIHEVKNVFIKFEITPEDGPVSDINFAYAFRKRDAEGTERFSKYDKTWCRETGTIDSVYVGSWIVSNHALEQILKEMSFQDFIKDYEIIYFIEKLNKDGKEISLKELRKEVPTEVRGYWVHQNTPNRDIYVKGIVENLFKEPYATKDEYLLDIKRKELKRKDNLVYGFLTF